MPSTSAKEKVLAGLTGVRKGNAGWEAFCPAHEDRHKRSLSIHVASDGKVLLKCHRGCETAAIVKAIGLSMGDLFPQRDQPKKKEVATYRYCDADGNELYEVVRYEPKDFKQRRPDGTWGLNGTQRVLYRLPQLVHSPERAVFIVEGEKDVDRLIEFGLLATCNPGGVGKWRSEFSDCLRDRVVYIVGDNDEPGRRHGQEVARSLYGQAKAVHVMELPGLPEKGDVSDWLDVGHTIEELKTAAKATPLWEPPAYNADDGVVALLDVRMKDVSWTWKYRIPRGQVTVIDGDPGESKSVLTDEFAATTSTGRPWPDGSPCERGAALIISAEDDLETTIAPRTLAAGGDPSMVFALKREFTLSEDCLAQLKTQSQRYQFKLVIIDPLSTAIPGGVSGWNDAEMRRVLRPLQDLARELDVAVVVVRHLNKGTGKTIYRGQGSIGIVAAVRMALLVCRDPEDRARRILAVEKSNLSPEAVSLAYRLEAVPVEGLKEPVVRIRWEGNSRYSADDLLASVDKRKPEQAKGFLAEVLAQAPRPSEEILDLGRQRGIGRESIWKAKKELGILARKRAFAGGWEWELSR